MKNIGKLTLLLATPFLLSSCSAIMAWYKKATDVVTKNDPLQVSVTDNGDEYMNISVKNKQGLTLRDDHHLSSENRLIPSSYNPVSKFLTYYRYRSAEPEVGIRQIMDDLRNDDNSAFYAFLFEISFERTQSEHNNLMFNISGSSLEDKNNLEMSKGMRLALLPFDYNYSNDFIWAPLQNRANCVYMDGNGVNQYYPDDLHVVAHDTPATYEWDNFQQSQSYLGSFSEDKTKLSFYGLIWIEGTDPSVVNENSSDLKIDMTLSFMLK